MEVTIKEHKTQFSVVTGDFITKVGTRNIGETATGQFRTDVSGAICGIGSKNHGLRNRHRLKVY